MCVMCEKRSKERKKVSNIINNNREGKEAKKGLNIN